MSNKVVENKAHCKHRRVSTRLKRLQITQNKKELLMCDHKMELTNKAMIAYINCAVGN